MCLRPPATEYWWLAKTSKWIIHPCCKFFKNHRSLAKTAKWFIYSSNEFFKNNRFFVKTSKWIFCACIELFNNDYNRRSVTETFKRSIDIATKCFA